MPGNYTSGDIWKLCKPHICQFKPDDVHEVTVIPLKIVPMTMAGNVFKSIPTKESI